MKPIQKLIIYFLAGILLTACDSFLDTTPEDLRSPDQMFESENSTLGVLMGVYSFIRQNELYNVPAVTSSADLDKVYTNQHDFNLGIWDASSAQYDKWEMYYKAIREATYFIENVHLCTSISDNLRLQWKAEARCLRAYFYANLLQMYGPVVLLKDELVDFTQDDLSRPRNTWDECVEWVCNEFLELSQDIYFPMQQTGANHARMSRSIAMAYRSRLLLQSASDQFNGNSMYASVKNPDGTALFPQTKDSRKWELARQAAQDVIDLGVYSLTKVTDSDGNIDPYASYKAVFIEAQNSETILPYLENGGGVNHRCVPNSIGGWGGGYNPTQEMVDLYAMDNGRYPITGYTDKNRTTPVVDVSAGYSEEGFSSFTNPLEKIQRSTFNMYINREPRFYTSVLYGGLTWFVTNRTDNKIFVEMFKNGNNGPDASHNHYSTGYALIKLVTPDYVANPQQNVRRELPYMRYAEILLNYIEATIETENLTDSKLFEYWNELRERAGVPPILDVYPEARNNKELLMDLLRRERRIELAYEGASFFDNRRWLIADQTEGYDFHGMNIQAMGTTNSGRYPDDFFRRTVFETRVFKPSFYLYPIPQKFLNRNHDLVQNYKW